MKGTVKLRYRLILSYIGIMLIPIIALGSISFYISLSIVRQQTVEQDRTSLYQISNNMDSIVAHMKSTSLIAYSSTLLQQYISEEDIHNLELNGDANIHNYLYSLKSADYDHYTFILKSYTTNSVYCNNYDYLVDPDYPFDALYWVEKAKTLKDATVFVPTYTPNYYERNTDPVFSIVRQLNDNYTLEPLGYIVINCDAKVMDDIVGDLGDTIYIYDEYNNLVYPYDKVPTWPLQADNNNEVQELNGEKYLVTQFTSNASGLKYTKITPYSELSQDSNLIIKITLLAILLAIVLSSFLSFSLSRRISTPINRLIENMNTINKDGFEESFITTDITEIQALNYRFNLMMKRINQHIQREYLAKIRKKDIEYKLLQAQISPHFLFNTLESIRMMAAINDDDETAAMIFDLANLYRYSIRITESLVPLKSELNHINDYVALQKMRFGDKFTYTSTIDDKSLNCKVPHLTLQPIIENAINHGFATIDRGGNVILTTTYVQDLLTITIHDNGSGMSKTTVNRLKDQLGKTDHQGHIGLLATCERIKNHFTEANVDINSEEGEGTTITIQIKYNPNTIY